MSCRNSWRPRDGKYDADRELLQLVKRYGLDGRLPREEKEDRWQVVANILRQKFPIGLSHVNAQSAKTRYQNMSKSARVAHQGLTAQRPLVSLLRGSVDEHVLSSAEGAGSTNSNASTSSSSPNTDSNNGHGGDRHIIIDAHASITDEEEDPCMPSECGDGQDDQVLVLPPPLEKDSPRKRLRLEDMNDCSSPWRTSRESGDGIDSHAAGIQGARDDDQEKPSAPASMKSDTVGVDLTAAPVIVAGVVSPAATAAVATVDTRVTATDAVGATSVASTVPHSQHVDRLFAYLHAEFKRKHGGDLRLRPRALLRLHRACERAMMWPSRTDSIHVELDSLFDGVDFEADVTRAQLEYQQDDSILPSLLKAWNDAKDNIVKLFSAKHLSRVTPYTVAPAQQDTTTTISAHGLPSSTVLAGTPLHSPQPPPARRSPPPFVTVLPAGTQPAPSLETPTDKRPEERKHTSSEPPLQYPPVPVVIRPRPVPAARPAVSQPMQHQHRHAPQIPSVSSTSPLIPSSLPPPSSSSRPPQSPPPPSSSSSSLPSSAAPSLSPYTPLSLPPRSDPNGPSCTSTCMADRLQAAKLEYAATLLRLRMFDDERMRREHPEECKDSEFRKRWRKGGERFLHLFEQQYLHESTTAVATTPLPPP